jgi:hypothetical protein
MFSGIWMLLSFPRGFFLGPNVFLEVLNPCFDCMSWWHRITEVYVEMLTK